MRVGFPPALPDAIARTMPWVLCIALACLDLDASASHGFASRTADMSPLAIALAFWYHA